MLKQHISKWVAVPVLALVAVLALSACATNVTGGGWIPSANPDSAQHANFGFVYKAATNKFTGTYHDQAAGVRLKFEGTIASNCDLLADLSGGEVSVDECEQLIDGSVGSAVTNQCVVGLANYSSQDRAQPGDGEAIIFACDNVDLSSYGPDITGNLFAIMVQDGPYEGYANGGILQGGNIQTH